METNHAVYKIEKINADRLLHRTILTRNRTIVFRGVSDSGYQLVPSAYRNQGKIELQKIAEAFFKENNVFHIDYELSQNDKERVSLMWFYDLANRQGINIPEIPHIHFGDPIMEMYTLPIIEKSKWMSPEWFEIAALAQHYGIPTRLLDWTFDMNAAIYFAIRNISEESIKSTPDRCFSVWELNKSLISQIAGDIRFIVPKYCDNQNIHAQSGILSVFDGNFKDIELPLEEIIQKQYESSSDGFKNMISRFNMPILTRLDIPYADVPDILQNFKSRGLRYEQYFPGLQGIVNTMKNSSGI